MMTDTAPGLLRELAALDPYVSPDDLTCWFCGRRSSVGRNEHTVGCTWVRAFQYVQGLEETTDNPLDVRGPGVEEPLDPRLCFIRPDEDPLA